MEYKKMWKALMKNLENWSKDPEVKDIEINQKIIYKDLVEFMQCMEQVEYDREMEKNNEKPTDSNKGNNNN